MNKLPGQIFKRHSEPEGKLRSMPPGWEHFGSKPGKGGIGMPEKPNDFFAYGNFVSVFFPEISLTKRGKYAAGISLGSKGGLSLPVFRK